MGYLSPHEDGIQTKLVSMVVFCSFTGSFIFFQGPKISPLELENMETLRQISVWKNTQRYQSYRRNKHVSVGTNQRNYSSAMGIKKDTVAQSSLSD